MKLCIADPGLQSTSGHHAGALAALVSACASDELICFGHHDADQDLLSLADRLRVPFRAHFSNYFYDAFGKDWTIAEAQPYVRVLTKDYLRLLQQPEVLTANAVLHHTMDWPHLLALAVALKHHDFSGQLPIQIVFLMFNPGVDVRGSILAQRRFLSYRIALSMLMRNPKVRVFAASGELSEIYNSAFHLPVRVEMHPCFFFNAGYSGEVHQELKNGHLNVRNSKMRILLYLGDAKAEKGFCKLPELALRLLQYLNMDSEVVIHYVLNDLLTSEALVRTANELQELARTESRVKLQHQFLSDPELMGIIAESSVVVFNYSPTTYANKTSGFLWQACSIDAPVAIIGESWLSREAEVLCSYVRVFSDDKSLASELKRYGTIRFKAGRPNLEYRRSLFRPLADFFSHVLSHEDAKAGNRLCLGDKSSSKKKVLFVDASVPNATASAGGHAAWQEMAMFRDLGYSVTFVPQDGCDLSAEELSEYRKRHVEVCTLPEFPDALTVLNTRGGEFDLVYITRFNVAEPLLGVARERAAQAKIVLNVADLHYLRQGRLSETLGYPLQMAEKIRQRELEVLSQVDMVLSYTETEIALIKAELGDRVLAYKCPWVDEIKETVAPYEARRDVAFLGSYLHAPNPDAVIWFANTVMPLLRNALPGVCFRVYGAGMASEVQGSIGGDVLIEGFVENLSSVYDRCRVFVAPLRFGAGLKGKVVGALCSGVPCVLSPVAAEGITTGDDLFAAIAESPQEWVDAIVRLYNDKSAWDAASGEALAYAGKHYTFDNALVQMRHIVGVMDDLSH